MCVSVCDTQSSCDACLCRRNTGELDVAERPPSPSSRRLLVGLDELLRSSNRLAKTVFNRPETFTSGCFPV